MKKLQIKKFLTALSRKKKDEDLQDPKTYSISV